MKSRPVLFILDAYSLIYQVFHALPLMTAPAGQPTQAVFGIFRDLLNIIRDHQPEYLVAAFDGAGEVFRSELYPEYKAQRAAMPDDLIPQIPVIRRVFDGFKVPILMEPKMEADDVIATVARRASEQGLDVIICTADKDARQLLNEQIRIMNLRTQKILDVAGLQTDWGIRPDQVVDLLSLTGDTVDNVPGIPGIGLKTASKLLNEFGDLETLLKSVDKVSGAKRKENLTKHADDARRARTLVALREDLPLELDWETFKVKAPDTRALKSLCMECGFHRFLVELPQEEKPPEATWKGDYRVINTLEGLEEFASELERQPRFCLDTETTGIDPLRAELVGLAFAWEIGVAYYLPVRGPVWDKVLPLQPTLDRLKPALTNQAIEKIGQNLKYDMHVLAGHGIAVDGPITDTMVLSYLLESGERNHNLDQLSERFLHHTMIPISDLIGKGKTQKSMDQIEVERVGEYAGEDADATYRLAEILAPKVREEGLWSLYEELERPLISVLARMEAHGIRVDVPLLNRLSHDFGERLTRIEQEIYEMAGRSFNIGSAPQLREILFNELGLPSLQKTPGGEPSTAQEVLEALASKHPLPKRLIEHRQLSKLKSTYLDTLPGLVNPRDGRVHASFNQGVAATGRLSSSDPNLQNIPVRTEDGRQIRQAFVPKEEGWSLLTADYSQIELRILAHYSGDPELRKAFEEDRDIHQVVASRIFNVEESAVTDTQRRIGKTVNFGVLYGLSPFGLAGRLGITQGEASTFIDAYFDEYKGIDAFIMSTLDSARESGQVETILGRRRPINGIRPTPTRQQRNPAERTAVNTVIQGSAADLIKRAMLEVDRQIQQRGLQARMLLQIHDELVLEAPDSEMPGLIPIVREAMVNALTLDVPLQVEIAVGPNWLDVQPVDTLSE